MKLRSIKYLAWWGLIVISINIVAPFDIIDSSKDCYIGSYIVSKPPFNKCSGYRTCEPGYYCIDGIKLPCTPGTYGDVSALNTSQCSGPCPAGYYCLSNSIHPMQNSCGGSNFYCPLGSSLPQLVPIGFYSIDADGSNINNPNIRQGIVQCDYGEYCVEGIRYVCPAGRYGSDKGLNNSDCSGACPEGFFCTAGSIRPYDRTCSNISSQYCPEGSATPLTVGLGYYTTMSTQSLQSGGGFTSQSPCPRGTYCKGGQKHNCPAGRYGIRTQETNSSCTGPCQAGYYCPEGSILRTQVQCDDTSVYCPLGSPFPITVNPGYYTSSHEDNASLAITYSIDGTVFHGIARITQSICEPGYYCPSDGVRRQCPPGRYGSEHGLVDSYCSGFCSAGYYCPRGSSSATQVPCGDITHFCSAGSSIPKLVDLGYYTVGGNETTRSEERRCIPGSYCYNATFALCLPGFYGDQFGQVRLQQSRQYCRISPTCTGPCAPGFYCPEGSISATEVHCGDPGLFCPGNDFRPTKVRDGYYSIGGNMSTRSGEAIAPIGYYARKGLLYPCPAGYYGATEGLSSPTCSGPCSIPGYFCPIASISPTMRYCGSDDVYCPAGVTAPIQFHPGFFTSDYHYEECAPGTWRNLSQPVFNFTQLLPYSAVSTSFPIRACIPCPTGTYKSSAGDHFSLCLPCPKNSKSSESRIICDCTTVYEPGFADTFNMKTGTCEKYAINDLFFIDASMWSTNTSLTRYQQFPCDVGYYCQHGQRFKCPAGTYGAINQQTEGNCTGLCKEGYFCPPASTSKEQNKCGAANLICPEGSAVPWLVPAGYYTNENVTEDVRYIHIICPRGYYCPGDGRRYQCPAGTYASDEGVSSDRCMGPCEKGYYCTAGSPSMRQYECGGSGVYCPTGSPSPTPVAEGFYCLHTGADAGESQFWDLKNSTCDAEVPCEPGYYCSGGIKQPCPPGTFGWQYGLTNSGCNGYCAPGYYCPSYLTPIPTAPAYTTWPQAPQVNATTFICGDVNYFCPRGSPYPTRVSGGFYSIGGNPDNRTRSGQVICPTGSYCSGAIRILCPPGRYGNSEGLALSSCTAGCPAGFYCPSGSSEPLPCPYNSYSTGLTAICNPCPAARSTPMTCQDENACCTRG